MKRRVLLTGAAGRLGRVVSGRLADRYDLLLTDARPLPEADDARFEQADIGDAARMEALCRGVDTVLHFAASAELDSAKDALLRDNVTGLRRVFEAACAAGCRRVVFTSSIHAVDGHPAGTPVRISAPTLPLTSYGASKALGETIAAGFARTTALSTLCLRLGWTLPGDDPLIEPENDRLDIILTYDDLFRLVVAAIEAPESLRFGVFHGLSNNRRLRLDLDDTRRVLGYEPGDDAFELARRRGPGPVRRWIRRARRALGRLKRR